MVIQKHERQLLPTPAQQPGPSSSTGTHKHSGGSAPRAGGAPVATSPSPAARALRCGCKPANLLDNPAHTSAPVLPLHTQSGLPDEHRLQLTKNHVLIKLIAELVRRWLLCSLAMLQLLTIVLFTGCNDW